MAYIGKSPTAVPLSASDLNDDIISLAKMASGTDGNLITYDAAGKPAAVATGTDGQVLTSAGAGNPCLFEAATGGGKLLQVVQTVKTDTFSTNSTSGTDITGLSVAITPSATSSKILITASIKIMRANAACFIKLQRDIGGAGYADSAYIGDAAGSRAQCTHELVLADYKDLDANFNYLDSPSTTSEVTYVAQGWSCNGSYSLYVNGNPDDTDNSCNGRYPSSITAMEIGA